MHGRAVTGLKHAPNYRVVKRSIQIPPEPSKQPTRRVFNNSKMDQAMGTPGIENDVITNSIKRER